MRSFHNKTSLGSFKAQIPSSLECQIATVTFNQHTKLVAGNIQFHPVAAFYLECYIVCSGVGCVVHSGTAVIVMVMMGHIGPLGDDGCRHGLLVTHEATSANS